MLRTILNTACRRLDNHRLLSYVGSSTRGLSSGSMRCVAMSNKQMNLLLATQPKRLPSQYRIIRNTSSDATGSDSKSNLSANERIDKMIKDSKRRVFLFMKGVPEQPQCGYSNAVVQILDAYGVEYDSFDVLSDDEVRKEIKTYSNWPTIPQLYVDKSFIGGCDILIQMHQNNELEALFGDKTKSA